jgi:hypothetical protein
LNPGSLTQKFSKRNVLGPRGPLCCNGSVICCYQSPVPCEPRNMHGPHGVVGSWRYTKPAARRRRQTKARGTGVALSCVVSRRAPPHQPIDRRETRPNPSAAGVAGSHDLCPFVCVRLAMAASVSHGLVFNFNSVRASARDKNGRSFWPLFDRHLVHAL